MNGMSIAPRGDIQQPQKRRPGRPRTGSGNAVATVPPRPVAQPLPSAQKAQSASRDGVAGYEVIPNAPEGMTLRRLLLTIDDVAAALSLKRSTVVHLLLAGAMPSYKIGVYRRVKVSDLEAYVAGLERDA